MSTYSDIRRKMAADRAAEEAEQPRVALHLCAAAGCRLAGALADSSHATSWWCAFHYAAHPSDIPRITAVLAQHIALVDAVATGRHVLTSVEPCLHGNEWSRLVTSVAHVGYKIPAHRIDPGRDSLANWLQRVEIELGHYVAEALTRRHTEAA